MKRTRANAHSGDIVSPVEVSLMRLPATLAAESKGVVQTVQAAQMEARGRGS